MAADRDGKLAGEAGRARASSMAASAPSRTSDVPAVERRVDTCGSPSTDMFATERFAVDGLVDDKPASLVAELED